MLNKGCPKISARQAKTETWWASIHHFVSLCVLWDHSCVYVVNYSYSHHWLGKLGIKNGDKLACLCPKVAKSTFWVLCESVKKLRYVPDCFSARSSDFLKSLHVAWQEVTQHIKCWLVSHVGDAREILLPRTQNEALTPSFQPLC